MSELIKKGQAAKTASFEMVGKSTEEKNNALRKITEKLLNKSDYILEENKKDLQKGKMIGLSKSTLDRIMLNNQRISDMANALELLVDLKDPIGETIELIRKDNGLIIKKKCVPLGVIGMIYEARPNVTIDAATLSLKTGNTVILKGSSSAQYSNEALVKCIHLALEETTVPKEAVQLITDTSREAAKELFRLNQYLDVLIPRGSKQLIETVINEATVPVIETGGGNCHLFIDETANERMALKVALNAKIQRPSVCNAIESIVIHKRWFDQHGGNLIKILLDQGVEIFGDTFIVKSSSRIKEAKEEDWYKEYGDMKISIKLVHTIEEAITHINKYGTRHSEGIITECNENAGLFLNKIDAAVVYHNASTRFTDGFEFGYGAEIGISTQKLHARGPMGLSALTSTKYHIYGNGQIRN